MFLQDAIRLGQVNQYEVKSGRYVWVFRDGICFEARLVNADQGTYKGYPLAAGEAPKGLVSEGDSDGD